MRGFRLIDSSAWLLYFFGQGKDVTAIIDGNGILLTASISLYEVKRKLLNVKEAQDKISSVLEFIKARSLIISADRGICEAAADISLRFGLAAVDSLIYATAFLNDAELVTADNDFRGIKGVRMV
ncbi:PIN domain-containing protein [Candidatus Woesearchaeota archaeon]|nr:PIN domain-containing protein [Candidatus Woesearchaeota archaeon]